MSKRGSKRPPALRDWHLWAEVKRTVVPLRPPAAARPVAVEEPLPIPAPPPPFVKPKWKTPALPPYRPQPRTGAPSHPPGRVIEPRVRRRVARGRIDIEGTLDLHGMHQNEARAALNRFILSRAGEGARTLLVITGKGLRRRSDAALDQRGVLRAMLPRWLAEPTLAPLIAGWDVSAPGHGGDGAFYVRLRARAHQKGGQT